MELKRGRRCSRSQTDLAQEIEEEFGEDNPEIVTTKPLLVLGAGINLRAGARWSVDAGYRFYRLFSDDPRISVNSAYGALKFHF